MNDPYLAQLVEVNKVFQDQIKTADQKAAYIFTFLLALLVWSAETKSAFKLTHILGGPWYLGLTTVVLGVSAVTSFACAVGVVLPRRRPGRSIMYWGAWPTAGERICEARQESQGEGGDTDFLFTEYLQNTATLANICDAKYRMVQYAFFALLIAIAAYIPLIVAAQ